MAPLRIVGWLALGLAAALGCYGVAGLIGGAIPANRGWREPAAGVVIYVESNGIHTGLILPNVAAGVDWRGLAAASDLRNPAYAGVDHVAIGWGDKHFFLDTPTWWDVRPGTVAAAAIGSDETLIHVEHIPEPRVTGPDTRRIVLTSEQYRRLAAFVRRSFAARGPHYPGYFDYDAFYAARGHYDALTTCNSWTGAALRYAGVRVGLWTPFPATVMWWF